MYSSLPPTEAKPVTKPSPEPRHENGTIQRLSEAYRQLHRDAEVGEWITAPVAFRMGAIKSHFDPLPPHK